MCASARGAEGAAGGGGDGSGAGATGPGSAGGVGGSVGGSAVGRERGGTPKAFVTSWGGGEPRVDRAAPVRATLRAAKRALAVRPRRRRRKPRRGAGREEGGTSKDEEAGGGASCGAGAAATTVTGAGVQSSGWALSRARARLRVAARLAFWRCTAIPRPGHKPGRRAKFLRYDSSWGASPYSGTTSRSARSLTARGMSVAWPTFRISPRSSRSSVVRSHSRARRVR